VLVGVPAALASAGVLASLLYGVGARDPLVLTGSVIAVLASALLAAVVPARRAASVDPMRALRVE
jgi:ABC-type antimicrobial peptide transport system permease subunit